MEPFSSRDAIPTRPGGATLPEVLVALGCVAAAFAVMLPALAQVSVQAPVSGSMQNLRVLNEALVCYAADWDGRQFTAVPDDLGVVGGSCFAYTAELGCYQTLFAGVGCNNAWWGYWGSCPGPGSGCTSNIGGTKPMQFNPAFPWGVFRLPNVKPIHDYLDGRYYSPTYYSPLDHQAFTAVFPAFSVDCEFVEAVPQFPSSYMFSPAAMYHPDVMRAPSAGGFQHPDTIDQGYASPAVAQARYPALKTWMMEHNWLRQPPGPCNPALDAPGPNGFCSPYLYNHGADAEPLAMFFDGSVRALRSGDVEVDDAMILQQTGGVDGLWSRDSPLGESGYFGDESFDGTVVSHHVLTTGGILGRDTLTKGGAP